MTDTDTYVWRAYYYTPSLPAAIIFTILFALLFFIQVFQLYKIYTSHIFSKRDKNLSLIQLPLMIGTIMESIGYIGRALSHYHTTDLGDYIMQTLLLLISPALFAATIYMVFGTLVVMLNSEKNSLVPTKFITKIFVTGDVLSFLLQAAGGGIMSGGGIKHYNVGKNVIIGGLFVQVIFFGFFIFLETSFYFKVIKTPISEELTELNNINPEGKKFKYTRNWNHLMVFLFCASMLIMVRSIYRLVEYFESNSGFIEVHEVFLYMLDSLMMFLTVSMLTYQNASDYLLILKTYQNDNESIKKNITSDEANSTSSRASHTTNSAEETNDLATTEKSSAIKDNIYTV